MGSKKKKGSRTNQGSHNGTPRSAQNDNYSKYAKYAGAVSNKSKLNYADLRLVQPENLKEYASENARPRAEHPSGTPRGQRRPAGGQSVSRTETDRQNVRSSPPKQMLSISNSDITPRRTTNHNSNNKKTVHTSDAKKSRSARAERQTNGTSNRSAPKGSRFGAWFGPVSSGRANNIGGKPSQGNTSRKNVQTGTDKSYSAGRTPRTPEYIEDEYSKALNNSDFYGPLLEKYYMKYPEKQEERRSSAGSSLSRSPRKHRGRSATASGGSRSVKANTAAKPEKSIAELAVKNRGTAGKKKYARVVTSGKAKGSVPIGPVHRRVHRRDRRQRLFICAAAVASTVIVVVSVVFSVFFRVDKIEVAGDTPYSDARITELCHFSRGDNIMFIDTEVSERQVIESLPYVESCKIKRAVPNMVEVEVTCANSLGIVEIGSGLWSIVSTSGKVLENITNIAVVSSSDIVMSVSYEPDIHTADELAEARKLPVLEGLEFDSGKAGEFVQSSCAGIVQGFTTVIDEAGALGMGFTKLKYTDRGYEAEYDGRINIVLGDTTDPSILKKRIEIANHIICVTGDISDRDMGEITYIKNQTFFNPTYDISEDELAKYANNSKSGMDKLAGVGRKFLDKGIDVLGGQSKKAGSQSSSYKDGAGNSLGGSISERPQAT